MNNNIIQGFLETEVDETFDSHFNCKKIVVFS